MNPSDISHATARVPQEVYQAALDRALKAEMLVKQMREALQELLDLQDRMGIHETPEDYSDVLWRAKLALSNEEISRL